MSCWVWTNSKRLFRSSDSSSDSPTHSEQSIYPIMDNSNGEVAQPVTLRDPFVPTNYTPTSCIHIPNVGASQYEIKSNIIQMPPSFYGLNNEDPYKHLDEFMEICSTMKLQNFTDDALRLTLFPFSLEG